MDNQQEEYLERRQKYLQLFLTAFCFTSINALAWFLSNGLSSDHLNRSTSFTFTVSTFLTFLCSVYGIISTLDCQKWIPSLMVLSPTIRISNMGVLYRYGLTLPQLLVISLFECVYLILLYLLHRELKTYENYLLLTPQSSALIDSVVIYSRSGNVEDTSSNHDQLSN